MGDLVARIFEVPCLWPTAIWGVDLNHIECHVTVLLGKVMGGSCRINCCQIIDCRTCTGNWTDRHFLPIWKHLAGIEWSTWDACVVALYRWALRDELEICLRKIFVFLRSLVLILMAEFRFELPHNRRSRNLEQVTLFCWSFFTWSLTSFKILWGLFLSLLVAFLWVLTQIHGGSLPTIGESWHSLKAECHMSR